MRTQSRVVLVLHSQVPWFWPFAAAGVPVCDPWKSLRTPGTQAVAKYDANKDGVLDYKELEKVAGPASGRGDYQEAGQTPPAAALGGRIANRQDQCQRNRRSHQAVEGQRRRTLADSVPREKVTGSGYEPIANAEVKFVPEDFLGPGLPVGTGTTDGNGTAVISQPGQREDDKASGMSPGFYRVEITKGDEIPAKYNKDTILGQEVASDVIGIHSPLVFNLEY